MVAGSVWAVQSFRAHADALPFSLLHVRLMYWRDLGVAALIGCLALMFPVCSGQRSIVETLKTCGLIYGHSFKYNRRSLLIRRVSIQ